MFIDRRMVPAALKKVVLMFAELMNPCESEASDLGGDGRGGAAPKVCPSTAAASCCSMGLSLSSSRGVVGGVSDLPSAGPDDSDVVD